ncbi:MAG: hypothetical protein ACLFR0_04765 [Alphaproteobacteria bacterium]
MSQKNSFRDFVNARAPRHTARFEKELDRHIQARLNNHYVSEDSYYLFIEEVMDFLRGQSDLHSPAINKIYRFADLVIENFHGDRGYVHTCLRHIQHGRNGHGYHGLMEEKLSGIFNTQGIMTHSLSQFFDIKRDGNFSLNGWGALVLDRLDEAQMLAIHKLDENSGVERLYTLQDLVRREKLWRQPA